MKICHITSVHPALDVRIFHRECCSLARAGHDVTILAPADFGERVVKGVRVLGLRPARNRMQRTRVWLAILERLRRLRPTVVHFHDPELLLLAQFFRPARLIYDCHEYVAEGFLTRPWIARPLRVPLARAAAVLEPALARRVDAIVVAAPGQADRFAGVKKPVTVLHNFPPLLAEPPTRISDGKTLIHLGAHAEVRGCRDMVEAMTSVRVRVPGTRLLLVGPFNHRAYLAAMRRLIEERGLEDAVHLSGLVPYQDASRWMAQADIGLMAIHPTAQHVRSIPSKIFDYMMAGLPIVATDLPEARRVVAEAQCGLLVEPRNPDALSEAISTLLLDPETRMAMGERGRHAYQTQFNWSCEEKKLLQLYERLPAT
jgi:hypothetical protein